MTRLILLRAMIGLSLASPIAAQSQHGAGISGHRIRDGVDANYLRESWGMPDSIRLAAAVLWRGRRNAIAAPSNLSAASSDSMRQDALRRGVLLAGNSMTSEWVEYDAGTRTALVLGHSYPVPRRDSVLVTLVVRADTSAGPPTVSTRLVACEAMPDAAHASADGQAWVASMQAATRHWDECLLKDPHIAVFVGQRPPR